MGRTVMGPPPESKCTHCFSISEKLVFFHREEEARCDPTTEAVGVPDGWLLAGHAVVGWPRGRHGPVRRRPLPEVVFGEHWGERADDVAGLAADDLSGTGPAETRG
jgi:hypothetical protein